MLKTCFLSLPLLFFPALAWAGATLDCPIEHARYTTMGKSNWTAGFRKVRRAGHWLSDVAFYVQSGKTNRKFWFMFDAGSARYINMVPIGGDPSGPNEKEASSISDAMHYLPVGGDMSLSLTMPESGHPAPAYILLPDLPEVMWYSMTDLNKREGAPLAFFKLSGCEAN